MVADPYAKRIVSSSDLAALAAYCKHYAPHVEAGRTLAQTPTLITLPSGYIHQNTWLPDKPCWDRDSH